MSFFNNDEVLEGIKRGAEKFGSTRALSIVKRMARRLNGFAPKEAEPYGLGLGGGDTEQMSQVPTQALRNDIAVAQLRQQNKLNFLVKELELASEPAEKEALEYEIKCIQAELAEYPATGDPDGEQIKDSSVGGKKTSIPLHNEDSSNLGYQSAQKTTTAQSEMKSKCPACGHESVEEWNGKCANCMMSNAEDVSGNLTREKKDNGFAPKEREPYAEEMASKKNAGEVTCRCGHDEVDHRQSGTSACSSCTCAGFDELASKENTSDMEEYARRATLAGVAPNVIMLSMKQEFPDKSEDVLRAAVNAAYKDIKEDPSHVKENAGNKCPECGVLVRLSEADENGKRTHECPQCHQKWDNRDLTNAGHLDARPWAAAATEERAVWLELAGQDINLATEADWNRLSQDVKKALQDVYDKPASANIPGGVYNNAAGLSGKKKFIFKDADGQEETVEAETLDKAWSQLADIFGEPASTLKAIGVKFVRENSDPEGDLDEIERAADGIKHEVEELKEEGLENCSCGCAPSDHTPDAAGNVKCPCTCAECAAMKSAALENANKWAGKKCPYCTGPVTTHPSGPYAGSPFCAGCGEVLDPEELKNKDISKSEIGEEIAHHIKEKGMGSKQAIAVAYKESKERQSAKGGDVNYEKDNGGPGSGPRPGGGKAAELGKEVEAVRSEFEKAGGWESKSPQARELSKKLSDTIEKQRKAEVAERSPEEKEEHKTAAEYKKRALGGLRDNGVDSFDLKNEGLYRGKSKYGSKGG